MADDPKILTGETDVPDVLEVDYTPEEVLYKAFLLQRLQNAYDIRVQPYTEFNDMTYQQYWVTNARAANSYIRPKVNQQDTRVVMGTTEEKTNTLISAALNNNFEPNILAYDKHDLPISELGTSMEDMLKKSRKIEDPQYTEARIGIYKEFFDQGTVFVEERFLEYRIPQKTLKKLDWSDVAEIKKIKWDTKFTTETMCQSNLITGLNVYLGSMKELYMCNQPYIFTREMKPRREVEAVYGKWERWKHVGYKTTGIFDQDDIYQDYNDYGKEEEGRDVKTQDDMVEVIKYQDKWNNEYMIELNGVMMLPIRFPLSALLGVSDYTIAKGDAFPISKNFAYSKSVPAKTKVEQQVYDEMMRLMVLKTQQSFKPPFANNTGKILSRNVLFPGKMTADIDPNKLKPLIDARGPTSAEFNAMQFIKASIDGKSVSPQFEGQSSPGEKTAREVVELKQQGMQKLGAPILGLINLEKRMAHLRLMNIIQNWFSPIDKKYDDIGKKIIDVYKTLTVDTDLSDGSKGQRIIEMTDQDMPSTEQVLAEEELLSRRYGKRTQKIYFNPIQVKALVHTYFIEMVPTPKETSELRVAMFNETLMQGMELFGGPQAFNMEHVKTRWANLNGEDPNKIFAQQSPGPALMEPGQEGSSPSNLQQQMTQGQAPQAPQRQSLGINKLLENAR